MVERLTYLLIHSQRDLSAVASAGDTVQRHHVTAQHTHGQPQQYKHTQEAHGRVQKPRYEATFILLRPHPPNLFKRQSSLRNFKIRLKCSFLHELLV